MGRGARSVRLAKRVTAGDERNGLFVVHRHAAERLSNVPRRGNGIRIAVGPFRVHVDEAHLHGAEWIRELAVAAVARVGEPGVLGPPVDLLRLPHIFASAAEAERLEPHRFQRAVAREHHQVCPGDLLAVLLLDRPQQPARLVEIRVVGPAVERRKALLAVTCAAAPVVDAIRARAVPGHPDEQRSVMAVVCGPPVLRRRHDLLDVLLQRIEIERLELRGIVEARAHGIARGRILMEHLEVQLIRPPVAVRSSAVCFARERALLFVVHVALTSRVMDAVRLSVRRILFTVRRVRPGLV